MAQQIQDEGFHEIQLNGKQLVFLFMAATVVSVVIFLCGVLVGRGVKSQLASVVDSGPASTVAETTPTQAPAPAPAPAAGSDPTTAPPPTPPTEDLSYFKRLEKQNGPAEQLKPAEARDNSTSQRASASAASPAAAPPSTPVKEPAPAKAVKESAAPKETAPVKAPLAAAAAASQASEPTGQGFAVQIAALNIRSEADAIAKRLNAKGYSAYVLTPANGSPSVFRVRIGKFNSRHEAETVAAKLQKEEQYKPWVTR